MPADACVDALAPICPVVDRRATTSPSAAATGGRWPCTGRSPARCPRRAAAVVPADVDRPRSPRSVRDLCNDARRPGHRRRRAQRRVRRVGAGRSAASCSTSPALAGIVDVDAASGVVEVLAGTFGPDLEAELQAAHGLTVGHFPQSFDIATVGGWVACRGAGQYSTRYGKIEDMVVGLEVVLADGRVVRTGGAPAAAVGPDLTQLFVGSEGTLGVDHAGVAARPPAPAGRAARGVLVRLVRRRARGLPADPAPRRDAGGAAALRRRRVGARPRRRRHALRAARARRGRRRRSSTPRWRSSTDECAAADRRRRRRSSTLARAPQRHLGAAGADPQGLRRRHDGDRRAVGPAARAVRRRARRRCSPCRTPRGRQLPPLAQLPRRRLPLLHVRRHAAARRGRVDLRRAVGRRPAGRARRRRQPLAPPRRRPQPRPLRGRGARRRRRRARRR